FISVWKQDTWAAAFSVIVPEMLHSSSATMYSSTNYISNLSQVIKSQYMMAGINAAASFDSYDFGVGVYVGHYTESFSSSFVATPRVSGTSMIVNQYQDIDVKNILLQLGLQKQLNQ